jgi:sarcosine oxidase gamma subunit
VFSESLAAMIQKFSDSDYRVLVDVSYAPFMAEWLEDAAQNMPLHESA